MVVQGQGLKVLELIQSAMAICMGGDRQLSQSYFNLLDAPISEVLTHLQLFRNVVELAESKNKINLPQQNEWIPDAAAN